MAAASWKWYLLALLVVLLDQLSKSWVSHNLAYGQPWVLTDFFNLTLLHNPGAAFSFLSDAGGWQRWFFTAVAAVVSLAVVVWIALLPRARHWEALALALVLGGAIGNLYDRVVLGYVVDFLVVHYRDYYWPAFNIADSAICVGAGLLIVDSLRGRRDSGASAAEK
ncbi:lipoprotein signal peptidase [Pseudomaricurvus alcaniphilus]|uniref:signal peptidase II n=1 Tax=Pseudomaricurvus alcaniphilus TaxID=1166482 RepID=UPI00140AF44E|nr:signal peptidase II [Pseudomaricurvus alcaniphilus]NHN39294.1 lipoprotein signal peptidase [Pseudomaricurvus alcaniphilus]